jgi:hypothetical protein
MIIEESTAIIKEVVEIDLPGLPVAIPSLESMDKDPLTVVKIEFRQIPGATFHVVPITPQSQFVLKEKHGMTVDGRSFAQLSDDEKLREKQIDLLMDIFPFWEGLKTFSGDEIPYNRANVYRLFWNVPSHQFSEYLVAAAHKGTFLVAQLEAENLKKLQRTSIENKQTTSTDVEKREKESQEKKR